MNESLLVASRDVGHVGARFLQGFAESTAKRLDLGGEYWLRYGFRGDALAFLLFMGLSVLLIEKSDLVGGTTAISAVSAGQSHINVAPSEQQRISLNCAQQKADKCPVSIWLAQGCWEPRAIFRP